MRQRSLTLQAQTGGTDASLTARAAAGEVPAFEELYRRHVDAAWRVAQAVTGNAHDAADAVSDAFTRVFEALPTRLRDGDYFRPYLLAAARNAAIDVLRRNGRISSTDMEELDLPAIGNEPAEMLVSDVDSSLVCRAFRSLPERWRSVLWLTEVEGVPPREAAELLGLSPNGVAQLAVRARAGLRERFLQAHLAGGVVEAGCRYCVEHLGAYVAGGLAPRDIAKVDQHLAGCTTCCGRVTELEDLGPALLRRAVMPMPVALAALTLGKWRLASSAASTANAAVAPGVVSGSGAAAAGSSGAVGAGSLVAAGVAPLVVSVASLALFVASVVGVGVVDPRGGGNPGPSLPPVSAPAPEFALAPAAIAPEATAAPGAVGAPLVNEPLSGLLPDVGNPTVDAPLPNAPLPNAPLPNAPLPNAPLPNAPLPNAPLPNAPLPNAPLPNAPLPNAPKVPALPDAAAILATVTQKVDLGVVEVLLGGVIDMLLGDGTCPGTQQAGTSVGCEPPIAAIPLPELDSGVVPGIGGLVPDVPVI